MRLANNGPRNREVDELYLNAAKDSSLRVAAKAYCTNGPKRWRYSAEVMNAFTNSA